MTVAVQKTTMGKRREKADVPGITRPMTYEEYMAGPEEMARYDIIDGWKIYRLYGEKQLANPTRQHQEIQGNLFVALRTYALAKKHGKVIMSPCDVRITLRPWRSRQPDVLFISNDRLAANPPADNPAPLSPAPELVVEIVLRSDKPAVLAAKIADYRSVDVREVWVVRSETHSIEVVSLSLDEIATVGQYGPGETVTSRVFPELSVMVDDIFAG